LQISGLGATLAAMAGVGPSRRRSAPQREHPRAVLSRAVLPRAVLARTSSWAVGTLGVLLLSLACSSHPPARPTTSHQKAGATATVDPEPPLQAAADARHLLERFGFGPRPGDVERVLEIGTHAWFERQLLADELPDPRGERAVQPYSRALAPPEQLPGLFAKGGIPLEPADGGSAWEQSRELMRQTSLGQLLLELQTAEIVRHVESEHQLREVMVAFWTDHFNVYAKKEEVRLLAGDYVERVIRPLALGRFADLLVATARHPAMLRYLDNVSNRFRAKQVRDDLPGINENYARELLELHTLGVNGGYTQADVVAAARILTGWSFRPGPGGLGYTFHFDPRFHDRGSKQLLGTTFAADRNEEEGLELLGLLARHPATAAHLAHKLCVRFVADSPPADCIEVTAAALLESDGDIKVALRALVGSRSFWSKETRRRKLKTPLEFLVSAVRGLDARLAGTTELARAAARLGEAPFVQPSPAGRIENSAYWLQSFTLARLRFAHDLAFGRVPGVALDRHATLAGWDDPTTLGTRLSALLLGGAASERTLAAIDQALAEAADEDERFSSGVALTLSSPEFQWR